MKIIALDVHRTFAQAAILENGKIRDAGRLELEREHILKFAERLNVEDEVVLEATVNTKAILRLLSPFVSRVIISNPLLVRAIALAKVKTDKIDEDLAQTAFQEPRVKQLMTITGVNMIVALSVLAAIGDIGRFSSPEKLVSYFGLNPRVRQSGDKAAYHGRITKQGRSHARAMLVEAAWSVSRTPGPLRAFFRRIREKRGNQIAAVATARKVTVVIWHMLSKGEDYIWSRPALLNWKLRKLELAAGYPSHRGGRTKGSAADYSLKSVRDREREAVGHAEEVYRRFVIKWKQKSQTAKPVPP